MVPVLGRVASGMRQVAWAELQQDLDSPQTRRRVCAVFCGECGRPERRAWARSAARHCWFERRPHSVVVTECGRR